VVLLEFKEEFQTHLLMGYALYPVAGTRGFLEFNIAATEYIFPTISVTTEKIPPDIKSSVLFSIGCTLKIWEGMFLKIIGGFGGRTTERTGYNLNVMTKFTF
jgi:hypothetical protein